MPAANSAFCKRPNTLKAIGFISFLYKLMLLQSFISLVLAKIAKLNIYSVFKNHNRNLCFPQSSIAGCYLFIELIGFFLS